MSNLYFGFALADSMFDGDVTITRSSITPEIAGEMISIANIRGDLNVCLNPSHTATIDAMTKRFNIFVDIPENPPQVKLNEGDSLIVMGVRGLKRLTDRHEYTNEEIELATFTFSLYTIQHCKTQ